jgi:hypothetical protein
MQESPCVLVEIVGLDRCQKIDVGRHTYARCAARLPRQELAQRLPAGPMSA